MVTPRIGFGLLRSFRPPAPAGQFALNARLQILAQKIYPAKVPGAPFQLPQEDVNGDKAQRQEAGQKKQVKRSTDRTLTTHGGSRARVEDPEIEDSGFLKSFTDTNPAVRPLARGTLSVWQTKSSVRAKSGERSRRVGLRRRKNCFRGLILQKTATFFVD